MKQNEILFLGTCACDYSPLLASVYKDTFDKDARRSSCALVNGQYLFDCGEHCLESLRIAKVNLSEISDIFITHLHSDHYNKEHIAVIAKASERVLRVWVREDAKVPDIPNVEWQYMQKAKQYAVSECVSVTGLLANHDAGCYPQHILLEVNGKKLFYALDGAWFLNETWYQLKCAEVDFLVLDATCGDYAGDYRIGEHNTIPMIRVMLPSLKTWKVVKDSTKIYLSHIAPSLHKPHQETEKLIETDGLKLAYDGLQVNI